MPPLRRGDGESGLGGNMRTVGRAGFGAAVAALVVLGTASVPAVASQGSPDTTFGTNGKVVDTYGAVAEYTDVALEPDGTIDTFGQYGDVPYEMGFAKYQPNGAPRNDFRVYPYSAFVNGQNEFPVAMLRQPDGKLIGVAVQFDDQTGATGLIRLNSDGTLDRPFGGHDSGRVVGVFARNFTAAGAALLDDGRIAVAGSADSTTPGHGPDLALVVLTAGGALDSTFGDQGMATWEAPGDASDGVGIVQQGTKLVVAGERWIGDSADFVATRFTAAGTIDSSFGTQGTTITATAYSDEVAKVLGQSDGKIVVAGNGYNVSGDNFRVELARYTVDGALDSTFGTSGIVTGAFDGSDVLSAALQADGKVIVSGGRDENFFVARYRGDGSRDVSFGCLGTTETAFGDGAEAAGVAVQADGRIVAVGAAVGIAPPPWQNLVLARYESDGGPGACGYELDGQGGLHRFGIGNPAAPPAASGATYWSGKDVARGVAVSPSAGGVVVDITGALHPFAIAGISGKPVVGSAGAMPAPNLARGVAMLPNGTGGYVLDGWGGMHPFAIGNNAKPPPVASPSWTNWNIARGVTILPDGTGGYIIDAWGGLHPFAIGNHARPPAASGGYWKGWDIARGVTVLADGTGGYVLDGWGGMHAFAIGNNPRPPAATAGYWQGWDIARGVAALP